MPEPILADILTRWSPRHPKCPVCKSKTVHRLDVTTYRCECGQTFPDADASQSSQVQEARCRQYAAERGYQVRWSDDEPDTSGKGDDEDPSAEAWYVNRPVLYNSVNRLKAGMVLLVTRRDRIGRSVIGQAIVRLDCARRGARIEAADEPNGETPVDKFTQNILASVSEYERLLIIARTRAAMQHHQAQGRRMSRLDRIPYGFMADPKDKALIVPNPDEYETIRIAREYHAAHPEESEFAVCRYMTSIGHLRRGGKTWHNAHRLMAKILAQ